MCGRPNYKSWRSLAEDRPALDHVPCRRSAMRAAILQRLMELKASKDAIVTPWVKQRGWGSGKYDRAFSLKLFAHSAVLI